MDDKVQILLSVYKPNKEYLIKQLISLNDQDYQNLELLIFDDGFSVEKCEVEIFNQYITNFSFKILPYENKTLGYEGAFEKLVEASDASYIAFCDQDDVWRKDKISKCVATLKKEHTLAVASDRMLIDKDDNIICESVRKSSKKNYESWNSGDDISKYNLFVTFAVGMSIVADGPYTRSILPFSKNTGHDKWLLSCASTDGNVSFIHDTLVQYRRHGNNVSGVLIGIDSKEDYLNKRVLPCIRLVNDFLERYPDHKDKEEIKEFAYARKNHEILKLIKYRNLAPDIAKFEVMLCLIPNFMFSFLVKLARKLS